MCQTDHSSIVRLCRMEQSYNQVSAALDDLLEALDRYKAVLPQLAALQTYYESPLWLQDYDADRAGQFPADLPRGVLSQDAIYDLLETNAHLRDALSSLPEYQNQTEDLT